MLTPLVLALVCLLPGLPLAVLLARRRPGDTAFSLTLVEGLVLGLCWYLALGVVLTHRGQLGLARVLVPTLALDAVVLAVLLGGPSRWWRGRVANPVSGSFGGFVLVTLVVGAALRTKPAYFIYDIGDFGEYVNRGNVLAHGGPFTQWFTRGFSILLALGHVALGEAHEVDVMGFLGLLVMVVALAIAARLGASRLGLAAIAVVFAIGVVPTWFSNFPASETPYAALSLGLVLFAVTAVQHRHVGTAVVGGLVLGFFVMLLRGNAVLLLPVVLATAVVVSPFVGRDAWRIVRASTIATVAGLYAGFVYDARYNHPYFIDFQMPQFLPDRVWHRFSDIGEVGPALWKGALFAVAVALVLVVASQLNRRLGPPADARWVRWARVAILPVGFVGGLLALVAPLDAGGLREALGQYDAVVQVLLVVGVLGALVTFGRRVDDHVRLGLVALFLSAEAFALLHAYRFPVPRSAPYYLYWDRYLWSDVFPAAMVLAAVGVGVVQLAWRRTRAGTVVTSVVVAVLAVAGVASLWSAGSLSRQHRFLGDAYGSLARIDLLTDDLPIVYGGILPEDMPTAMGKHPNTFRMFAQPLTETFGREVFGIAHLGTRDGDPRPTLTQVADGMLEEGLREVAYVEVVEPNRLPPVTDAGDPRLQVRTLGSVRVEVPMLNRPRWHQPTHWRFARFRLVVHEVVLR